ncbi:hypothetical protein KR222_000549, partial [Zaprionus bogoriensis]
VSSDGCQSGLDAQEQAAIFLKRHFGKGGSIEKNPELCKYLIEMGQRRELAAELKAELAELMRQDDDKKRLENEQLLQQQQQSGIYTCRLVHIPQPQRATVREWPKGKLQVYNCAWHLKHCVWRNVYNGEFRLPNCYCEKIKQTMNYIDELMSKSLPGVNEREEEKETKTEKNVKKKLAAPYADRALCSDINANITSLNGLLNQLNQLLELQQQQQEQL